MLESSDGARPRYMLPQRLLGPPPDGPRMPAPDRHPAANSETTPTMPTPHAASSRTSERTGFSLVELLVVIAVIGILLSILLPSMPRIRDAAQRTRCAANLSGVGKGLLIFMNENRDRFPEARYMPPPWLSADTDPPFNVALESYIDKYSDAYQCPGDRVVHTRPVEPLSEETCGMSYTYITGLSGQRVEDSFFAQVLRMTPSDIPVLYDFDGGAFETQYGETVVVGFFHARRVFLYADGSARTIVSAASN
ncbi:MAG: type II secretion system protein [Phycisphaerales bacterium]|nr:MAG: type II secretion system protein [Phycisphaerales bacterium]